jgi:hypothetical protein
MKLLFLENCLRNLDKFGHIYYFIYVKTNFDFCVLDSDISEDEIGGKTVAATDRKDQPVDLGDAGEEVDQETGLLLARNGIIVSRNRGRCYDPYFLRFSPIFSENFGFIS